MILRKITCFAILILLTSCASDSEDLLEYYPRETVATQLTEYTIPGTTIRAIEVLNDSTVWFAGSDGKWGYTLDNGDNWTVNVMEDAGKKPHFRSIAVQENGDVFLVAIQEPAAIFKSSDLGENWTKVHAGPTEESFFDAIEFWDKDNGILLGDPTNNCFYIALTSDGGETWEQVDCSLIPATLDEEYPFAASNTNIALSGTHAWFGTGGKSASRVFHSPDLGKSWEVFNTPIVSGQGMTGIYSIDFHSNLEGVITGGNWDVVNENTQNIAFTKDGGGTWNLVLDGENMGYTSCVQYIPSSEGKELFLMKGRAGGGNSEMGYLHGEMDSLQVFPNTNYLTIQFANLNTAWVAGKNRIGKLEIE